MEQAEHQQSGVALRRRMTGRDPSEATRASTPLELLFDLCFVVAVSFDSAQLHQRIVEGHLVSAVVGYLLVFFAIWWAWVNFTWFASAYDTDDVPYRLLTLLQMAGVLVFSTGIPAGARSSDFTVMVLGYVIMRVALIAQWLRAAREHSAGRPAALRYAIGVGVAQLGSLAWVALPQALFYPGFAVLALIELAVPIWAEYRGTRTAWHPEHIAERYGLFTIIVLGEAILGTTTAFGSSIRENGVSGAVVMLAAGALLVVFGLWWAYFKASTAHRLSQSLRVTAGWAYGHYLIFAATASLGAGFEVAIETQQHHTAVTPLAAALTVAVPLIIVLITLTRLQRRIGGPGQASQLLTVLAAALVLVTAAATPLLHLGPSILLMGVILAAAIGLSLVSLRAADPENDHGERL